MEFLSRAWRDFEYDHSLSPVTQVTILTLHPRSDYPIYLCKTWRLEARRVRPSIFSEKWFKLTLPTSRYTCIWNILDYSALSFPTGLVAQKEVDIIPPDQKSFGDLDSEVQSKCELCLEDYPKLLWRLGRWRCCGWWDADQSPTDRKEIAGREGFGGCRESTRGFERQIEGLVRSIPDLS